MWHTFVSHLSFAPSAVVGVGLILVYFIWMMYMAGMRIKKGDHMHH